MIMQSLGSMVLGVEALRLATPDVFFDSTGFAFTFFAARVLAGARVGAYVHYPTISTDMLSMVFDARPSYNNDASISGSRLKSGVKLMYYSCFAALYGLVGRLCEVVMVNSHWTYGHVSSLWGTGSKIAVVFPPCDTAAMQAFSLTGRRAACLSIGQFRPEKDHPLQLRAFKVLPYG
jgi:alpha-1,2-mannosyltransferase